MKSNDPLKITGQKLTLRDFQLDDLNLYAHWLQPGHEWQKLDGPYYPRSTPEEIARMVAKGRERLQTGELLNPRRRLVIAENENDGFIGTVNWYWVGEETNWPAAGIAICDTTYWRQGFGYEALGLWSDYLFRLDLNFARLDIRTWSGNTGMMRLAEKLGYQQEARFRKARIVEGQYYDGIGYGILREEWEALHPNGFEIT